MSEKFWFLNAQDPYTNESTYLDLNFKFGYLVFIKVLVLILLSLLLF